MKIDREAPIGVFDSGVGGLTVAREIMRNLPSEKIVYFGDTARVPYGSKSKETIIRYSRQIIRFLQEQQVKAIEVLCYGIAKFVGGYVAAMNGVDAIVFTAGIGENAIPVREKVVSYLGYLGVELDKEANGNRGEEIVISTPDSKVKVAVIPTNEELAICRETVALV